MDIRTRHLTKRYGRQTVVDDVSFTVHSGEVLGFLGPNGAGKTTTMRMICGLTSPDGGQVWIGDRPVQPGGGPLGQHIGYLPESNPLYDDMPVLDLLRFGAKLQGVASDRIHARIGEMVEACGLGREKHKRIGELSRGYRQRAGLALAMVHDPAVLVLDEPTTGLDPNQVVEIRNLIKELGRTKTVIFSTHILPEVEAVCDRVLIINKGRIVADGPPEQLRAGGMGGTLFRLRITGPPPERVLAAFRDLPQVAGARAVGPGTYEVLMEAPQGERLSAICVAHGWALGELSAVEGRLEDIFREATNP